MDFQIFTLVAGLVLVASLLVVVLVLNYLRSNPLAGLSERGDSQPEKASAGLQKSGTHPSA